MKYERHRWPDSSDSAEEKCSVMSNMQREDWLSVKLSPGGMFSFQKMSKHWVLRNLQEFLEYFRKDKYIGILLCPRVPWNVIQSIPEISERRTEADRLRDDCLTMPQLDDISSENLSPTLIESDDERKSHSSCSYILGFVWLTDISNFS